METFNEEVCDHPKRTYIAGCPGCQAYRRKLYHRNKENNPEKRRELADKYRRKRLAWLNEIKQSRGCADCGYNENGVALDFDHVDGEKRYTISQINRHRKEIILAEIEKCEVVCSNCHRIRTYNRANGERRS